MVRVPLRPFAVPRSVYSVVLMVAFEPPCGRSAPPTFDKTTAGKPPPALDASGGGAFVAVRDCVCWPSTLATCLPTHLRRFGRSPCACGPGRQAAYVACHPKPSA